MKKLSVILLELGHCSYCVLIIWMKIYIVPVPNAFQKEPLYSGSVNRFRGGFAFLWSDLPSLSLILNIWDLLDESILQFMQIHLQLNQIFSAFRSLSVVWSPSNASTTVLTIQSFDFFSNTVWTHLACFCSKVIKLLCCKACLELLTTLSGSQNNRRLFTKCFLD